MAIHMFQQLIDTLKKSPKRIVFTEGTDARILEASARLLAGTWLAPILIGNEAEVKAAAEEVGFNIRGAEIIDPATYPDMDKMVEEMVALHQAGQTVAQIAARFGFHRTTVARHLKQAGETLRTDPADPAFQERVREAYAELGTVKHTAQWLGVSKDTVRKVVRGE